VGAFSSSRRLTPRWNGRLKSAGEDGLAGCLLASFMERLPLMFHRRGDRFAGFALMVTCAVGVIRCSGSSTAPTPAASLSSIAVGASTLAIGGSGQGTVTLSAPASATTSVMLSTSNSAVATVQTPVTIPAGSSSTTFVITAVAAGTVTITASLNGTSRQSAMLTVSAQVALASISLSASSVVGGGSVTGTVTLTGVAPGGGAVVLLSAADPLTVPGSVTVLTGLTTAVFNVSTRVVGGTIAGTVSGSYGGGSASVVLSVTPPTVATAVFGITGPTESDTCTMASSGATLNCTFDGSRSTAPGTIIAWDWTYRVATMFGQTTMGPVLTMPTVSCALMPAPPLPTGSTSFTLIVTLVVRDNLGNVSAVATDSGARLLPQGVCGF
jgi:hypothetical protein